MLPLSDGIPARRFPVVNVLLIVANFAVSGLATALGGIVPAISVVCIATALPAVAIFLAVAPETAGQDLDQASLENASLAASEPELAAEPRSAH